MNIRRYVADHKLCPTYYTYVIIKDFPESIDRNNINTYYKDEGIIHNDNDGELDIFKFVETFTNLINIGDILEINNKFYMYYFRLIELPNCI
jgi:hypothetical protein